MKIGIYGDSFGDSHHNFKNLSKDKKQRLDAVGDSWVEILAKKYQVTNFCKYSSSFSWSVNNFVKTQNQFDKVIFLVTSPDRITMGFPHQNQPTPHMVDLHNSKLWQDRAKKEGWSKHLNAVLDYYVYVHNKELVRLSHDALLAYIKSIRSDTILIPCFEHSYKNHGNCMSDIYQMENNKWGVKDPITIRDIRKCHMTKENNKIFANFIEQNLNNNDVTIDISQFKVPDESSSLYLYKDMPYE